MNESLPDDVLRRLQDAIATETGVRVDAAAAARLHAALQQGGRVKGPNIQGNSRQEVTILFADLRGFTTIAEVTPADQVLDVLNRFLTRMCEIVCRHDGTVDKFMGDAVMVLFGAPHRRADDARRAVACAAEMQLAMDAINHDHAAAGLPPLYLGAGINTGHVMAGMLGPVKHSEYTVVGKAVNLASRIEAFSQPGQILISETTFEQCGGFVATGEPMDVYVKGRLEPVRLREVFGIPSLGLEIPRHDVRKSRRVEARIPFTYQRMAGNAAVPPRRNGMVLDISYEGVLAEVQSGMKQDEDILMVLDLSLIGSRRQDVHGRVRSIRADKGHHFAGIEFTSMSPQGEEDIRRFVQLLIQGSPTK